MTAPKPAAPLPEKVPALARMSGEDNPFTILGAVVPRGAPMLALLKIADERKELVEALREIETICTESASDCRKRMGTRVGNSLAAARALLRKLGEES